jgi:hypothetical protein
MQRIRQYIPIILYALLAAASLLFQCTAGFIFEVDTHGHAHYVSELLSPGLNDNMALLFSTGIMLAPLAARLSPKRLPIIIEAALFAIFWLSSLTTITTLEAGSIRLTLLHDQNPALAVWLLAFASLPCSLAASWRRERNTRLAQLRAAQEKINPLRSAEEVTTKQH